MLKTTDSFPHDKWFLVCSLCSYYLFFPWFDWRLVFIQDPTGEPCHLQLCPNWHKDTRRSSRMNPMMLKTWNLYVFGGWDRAVKNGIFYFTKFWYLTEGVILNVSTFVNFHCPKILKDSKLQLTMMNGTIAILAEPLYFRLKRNGPSFHPTFKVSIIKKNVEKNLENNPHSKNWCGKRWSHIKCPTPLLNGKICLESSNSYSFMQQASWQTCWSKGNLIIS